jgi:hypothetical protein
MLLAGMLVIAAALLLYGAIHLFKGAPDYYRQPAISAARREVLAQRALHKFADVQNAAALARQNQLSTDRSAQPIIVSFTDDELNAFFQKWEAYANWQASYQRYLEDPLIIIRDDHIILAAEVKELDAIVSLQFAPEIAPNGQLDLKMDRVLAGNLPLPDVLIDPYKDRLSSMLTRNLPDWRAGAAINPDGAANADLISAAMARLFIHALHHQPADAVLFLPLVERRANVPVRISDVKLQDHTVTITVLPLTPDEREALADRIKGEEAGDGASEQSGQR